MRFAHEMSYLEMFRLSDSVADGEGWAVKVDARLPIDLYVIDLGGGLVPEAAHRSRVGLDDLACAPLRALLDGMTHEALRRKAAAVNLRGFFGHDRTDAIAAPHGR